MAVFYLKFVYSAVTHMNQMFKCCKVIYIPIISRKRDYDRFLNYIRYLCENYVLTVTF